jgi:hypothetical protein
MESGMWNLHICVVPHAFNARLLQCCSAALKVFGGGIIAIDYIKKRLTDSSGFPLVMNDVCTASNSFSIGRHHRGARRR